MNINGLTPSLSPASTTRKTAPNAPSLFHFLGVSNEISGGDSGVLTWPSIKKNIDIKNNSNKPRASPASTERKTGPNAPSLFLHFLGAKNMISGGDSGVLTWPCNKNTNNDELSPSSASTGRKTVLKASFLFLNFLGVQKNDQWRRWRRVGMAMH